MPETYRELRDQLMHGNGTTPLETVALIVPSFGFATLSMVLVSLLKTRPSSPVLQFFIEFAAVISPIILNVTIWAPYTAHLFVLSLVLIATLSVCVADGKPSKAPLSNNAARNSVTNARATVNIISVIAILAVDFQIFPRRLAKTEHFGFSLMDVGVGLFMFSNGIVDGGRNPDFIKALKGALPLVVLGAGRFVFTQTVDYHVPVSEYGLHWNFFITLAVTKIFVSLIFHIVDIRFVWINATLLMLSHEVLLEMGFKNFVLANQKRDNFIAANREGLVSEVGYTCVYVFSAYYSYFLNLRNETHRRNKRSTKFLLLIVLSFAISFVFGYFNGVSRKLVNTAYVFWVLFIGFLMLGLFYAGEKCLSAIFKQKVGKFVFLPFIYEAVNYNGLIFFLVGNLLTGLINIFCDTLKQGTVSSLVLIFTYMFVNCGLVCVLHSKGIKLKL